MSKKLTLTEQIEAMEHANSELAFYKKLFDKACQQSFNMNAESVKKSLKKDAGMTKFEAAIRKFFGIKNDSEMNDFLRFICTEKTKSYFQKSAEKVERAEQG